LEYVADSHNFAQTVSDVGRTVGPAGSAADYLSVDAGQIVIDRAARLNLGPEDLDLKAEERLHKDVAVPRSRQAELAAGKCLGLTE
jgi:hypothetical protein